MEVFLDLTASVREVTSESGSLEGEQERQRRLKELTAHCERLLPDPAEIERTLQAERAEAEDAEARHRRLVEERANDKLEAARARAEAMAERLRALGLEIPEE